MIRVLTIASPAFENQELHSLLRAHPSFEVIAERFDPRAIENAIARTRPAVVLAEIEDRDDEWATVLLDEAESGVPVVLLVPDPVTEWADVFAHGVRAVLPNSAGLPQIVAAIEAVAAGLGVFYPGGRGLDAPIEALTPRELEVLRLMAEGLGNKEIASRLKISEHTAKFHVGSVLGKLGAQSRTEAVMLGVRKGIVPI